MTSAASGSDIDSSKSNENETSPGFSATAADRRSFSALWTRTINSFHQPYLKHVLHPTTQYAARNPKLTMLVVTLLSFSLVILGLFTNFYVESDGDLLWTPQGVRTVRHRDWILQKSGYPLLPRSLGLMVHAQGDNLLDISVIMERSFQALDTLRNLPGYDKACQGSTYRSPFTGELTCEIMGATKFWNNSATLLEADNTSDLVTVLSQTTFPDDTPVSDPNIYGLAQRDSSDGGRLTSVVSLVMVVDFPETDAAQSFETHALDALEALASEWDKEGSLRLEYIAERSVDDEIGAAIVADIPLVPIVFTIMGIFTSVIFSRRDPVQSRAFLGFIAVVSVLFSIMSGYGLMFICGINFTSMTQLLPFVIFGIGLDDTFVIMGGYTRTDPSKDTLVRIHETMEEVGTSITLTTLTSTLAFGLGCLASIPAVYWLCLYAVPTVAFVYLYQITYFVAAIVLDERRIKQDHKDLFMCCRKKVEHDGDDSPKVTQNIVERFIEWYADFLLQPAVKVVVVILFSALLGLCAWSASQLEQSFDVADVMPDGSYASDFIEFRQEYSERNVFGPYAYFRYVDQSQTLVQHEMIEYINDLVTIESIKTAPAFFWVEDFQEFVQENEESVGQLPFNDQLDAFLAVDEYGLLYGPDLVRDEVTGSILVSRVRLQMDGVVLGEVNQEIAALEDQAAVAARQPANQVRKEYAYFLYDDLFQIWEFYATSVDELILTTILGVVSVTAVSLLLIPHYTAALFVLPMISILYVDLLGVMQWGGVTIDPVSYVTCVMSIGLLVDFIIHVLLRYYECPGNRREKTVAMLKSMGVSVLTGGISTFLGTIPLAFSTSTIFSTVFIAFLGLSTLGVGHGLILLPVVLSTIGPEDQVRRVPSKEEPSQDKPLQHEETVETA